MADSTIANLPSGSPAQTGDQLPIQRSNSTLKILVSDILALVTAGVSSVFGRTGVVTAQSGDYSVAQVTGAAPLASPALSGIPTAPTAVAATNTTQIATTAFVESEIPLRSAVTSVFTRTGAVTAVSGDYTQSQISAGMLANGTTATTQTALSNDTKVSTDAYVDAAVAVETARATTAEATKQATLTGTGLARNTGASTELSGDATTFGSNAVTVVKVNGGSLPASKTIVGTNGSGQLVDASAATLANNTTGTAANLSGTPVLPNGTTATTQTAGDNSAKLATNQFVTTAINNAIAGVNPAVAVLAASTNNLVGTYTAVGSGIGDTFTVTAQGAFSLDGIAINTIGQRILLKNQTDATQNGVYTATVVGASLVSPVFTRALDYDQPSDVNNTGAIPVQSGSINTTTSWVLTSQVTSIGPSGSVLTYAQFSYAPANNPAAITTKTSPYTPVQADGTILCNGNVASPITNVVETSGSVVTLTATNTLVAGQTVYLIGLTTAPWLNGLIVTVSATGLSGSQFQFTDPTAHGTQASHAETGTATLLVVITLSTGLISGTTFRIKNIGATTVTLSSAVNIDGATTYQLNPYQYTSVDVQWDGTQWWIL